MPNHIPGHLNLSDMSYSEQLDFKIEQFRSQLCIYYDAAIDKFESADTAYRMRAEFRVWHDGDQISYAMYKPGSKELFCIDHFAPASLSVQALMPKLLTEIGLVDELKHRLFSIEYLSTLSGEMLVTLIYHRPLDPKWESAARDLKTKFGIKLIGRSRKQKIVLDEEFVTEQLSIEGNCYRYRQLENSFTQPNALVNQQMVTWACQEAKGLEGDLLELYCGNGNFSLPLSKQFCRVLTTEVSKTSIAALKWNLEANGIDNIDYARLSAEEITQALDSVRAFRRLSHIDLNSYQFTTVFVDPPRAGVDKNTLNLLSRFENIIYVSCNPITLIQNLEILGKSHSVVSAAAFDQFPFTPHLEVAVRLKRLKD